MTRRVACASLMLTALVGVVATPALGAPGTSAVAASKPKPIFWKNFEKPAVIEPGEVEILYGTGFASANKFRRWDGWGSVSATTVGVAHLNTCRPDCAAGNYRAYAARVTLFKVRFCQGQRRYIDVKITFGKNKKMAWGSNCAGAQVKAP